MSEPSDIKEPVPTPPQTAPRRRRLPPTWAIVAGLTAAVLTVPLARSLRQPPATPTVPGVPAGAQLAVLTPEPTRKAEMPQAISALIQKCQSHKKADAFHRCVREQGTPVRAAGQQGRISDIAARTTLGRGSSVTRQDVKNAYRAIDADPALSTKDRAVARRRFEGDLVVAVQRTPDDARREAARR